MIKKYRNIDAALSNTPRDMGKYIGSSLRKQRPGFARGRTVVLAHDKPCRPEKVTRGSGPDKPHFFPIIRPSARLAVKRDNFADCYNGRLMTLISRSGDGRWSGLRIRRWKYTAHFGLGRLFRYL